MGGVDKIFTDLGGAPLLSYAVEAFQAHPSIDQLVVVVSEENLERGRRLAQERGWSKMRELCRGGPRRQDSVAEGLKRLEDCQWVVIHDGARPLVSPELISRGLEEASGFGAAIAGVPVNDTIKVVGEDGFVLDTPDRKGLWAVQTPQVFRSDIIKEAYFRAYGEATDDAMLVERLGYRVKVYMGSYDNIKVTTRRDLALAEAILKEMGKL